MIVVDTSVWVDYLNFFDTPQSSQLDKLIGKEPLLVGDLIMCELLQGVRSQKESDALEARLRDFAIVSMVSPVIAVAAAKNYRTLRARGVTVRKTIDLLIGTYCITYDHWLLHNDRDFEPMQRYLGLHSI